MEKRSDLKCKAYSLIKAKIINCELLPEQDISEIEIAEQTGMSRTPVREALMKLEHEKMITVYPRKGIVVSPLSVDIINDIFQIRQMIEPQILKTAAKIISEEWLHDMRKRFDLAGEQKISFLENAQLDIQFHIGIVKALDNSYLSNLMENIYDHDQRIRIMSSKNKERLGVSNSEHVCIIDKLIEKDIDAAVDALFVHLENAHASALKLGR